MEKRIYINNEETPFWIEDTGRLRNEKTGNYLKGGVNKGYHLYNVYFRGKQYTLYTHKLVANNFVPNPNPDTLTIVHHKDENKLNNNYLNLEWVDSKEHSKIHGEYHPRVYQNLDENVDISQLKQFRNSPYWVSKDGDVYNMEKKIKMRPENSGKYQRISCNYNLKGKHFQVHRMVWEAFNGEIPEGMEVDHIDSNPKNNALNNLQLLSHVDNCKKANYRNISVYSINEETGEKILYSSLSEASRAALNGSRDAVSMRKIIDKHILKNNCYWYYEE